MLVILSKAVRISNKVDWIRARWSAVAPIIDMHYGWNAVAPVWQHIACNGHEPTRIGIDLVDIENFTRSVGRDYRSERHKFGAIETRVEQIVCLASRRIGEDRRAPRARGPYSIRPV